MQKQMHLLRHPPPSVRALSTLEESDDPTLPIGPPRETYHRRSPTVDPPPLLLDRTPLLKFIWCPDREATQQERSSANDAAEAWAAWEPERSLGWWASSIALLRGERGEGVVWALLAASTTGTTPSRPLPPFRIASSATSTCKHTPRNCSGCHLLFSGPAPSRRGSPRP